SGNLGQHSSSNLKKIFAAPSVTCRFSPAHPSNPCAILGSGGINVPFTRYRTFMSGQTSNRPFRTSKATRLHRTFRSGHAGLEADSVDRSEFQTIIRLQMHWYRIVASYGLFLLT